MWLIASDLHLTDLEKDSYRLGIFDFLAEQGKKFEVDEILLLGDITDRKDHHPGRLINRIVSSVVDLSEVQTVRILQGNHDYADIGGATLKILKHFADWSVRVHYYDEPTIATLWCRDNPRDCFFLPFQRSKEQFLSAVNENAACGFSAVFFHQTFTGASTSTGLMLPGVPVSAVDHWAQKGAKMFSGDIHVPQKIGSIEYVGSPYQINFGDRFEGRVVLYNPQNGQVQNLRYPCLRKHTVDIARPDDLHQFEINRGDQVKVLLYLTASEQMEWKDKFREIEEIAEKAGFDLFNIEVRPKDEQSVAVTQESNFSASDYKTVFESFCAENSIPDDIVAVGKDFINPNRVSE